MKASQGHLFQISHISEFKYTEPAHRSVMLLHLHPRSDCGQKVYGFHFTSNPAAAFVVCSDAFGNTCHLLNLHRKHQEIVLESRVEVETRPAPILENTGDGDGWDRYEKMEISSRNWEFLKPSRFVYSSPALHAFMKNVGIERGDRPLSTLMDAASILYRAFEYVPGSTEVNSPIEHILETGRGVCQDYTHVMIAIARTLGIPGRYVSGYLHLEGVDGEQSPAGESHAWGEFLIPSLGWIGFDPTNDTVADHRHIRIAIGRDYEDAAPTRGSLLCSGQSEVRVRVTVSGGESSMPETGPHSVHTNSMVSTSTSMSQGRQHDQ